MEIMKILKSINSLILFAGAILTLLLLLIPVDAYAHILSLDETINSGVVLHINPDDDPVSGKETEILFDIQNSQLNTDSYVYSLTIDDHENNTHRASVYYIEKQLVASKFIFPATGKYELRLIASPSYVSGINSKPSEFIFELDIRRSIYDDNRLNPASLLVATLVIILSGFLAYLIFKPWIQLKINSKN